MIDGIAGSGKSTILRSADTWAKQCGHRVFHLGDWMKEHKDPPTFEEVNQHDVFFTSEPTRTWVGAAIRFELSRTDLPYSGTSLAHAFALDREIMYKRLIIPALEAGKTVIQDRGVCTSLVYQPIMEGGMSLRKLLKLPGNTLALKYAPDALILTDLDPEVAVERLRGRSEESRGIFADLAFLRRVTKRFRSHWFSRLFHHYGCSVHSFDTDVPLPEMMERSQKLLDHLLPTC